MRAARWVCLSHRAVVHLKVAADRPNHDLPRVEADPNLRENTLAASHLFRIPFHRLLHPEGRVAGTHGMILMSQRSPEERHDPVSHDLVDRALVAMDGLHHVLEDGVQKLAGFLGITVGQQLHRTLQVGKQDGDVLALAFESSLRREDLFGQVLRGIRVRRGELGCGGCPKRRGALAAELILGRVARATGRAACERCRALPTELRACGIVMLAPGTPHAVTFSRAIPMELLGFCDERLTRRAGRRSTRAARALPRA
jgi:hypothetical protein